MMVLFALKQMLKRRCSASDLLRTHLRYAAQ